MSALTDAMRGRNLRSGIAAAVVGLAFVAAPAASAKTVQYVGEGVNLQPGQTQKGQPILIVFDLHGSGCPTGPSCFKHATVSKINAVSWAYPDCPEVLDGYFDLARGFRVGKAAPHSFEISSPSDDYAQDHIVMQGRIKGRKAKGTFSVDDGPCSTGTVHWNAEIE